MRLKGRADPDSREGIPAGFLVRDDREGGERAGVGIKGKSVVIAGALAAVFCVSCVLVAADFLANSGHIHRGVSVGEVDLGGMSRSEAAAALEKHGSRTMDEITLRGPRGEDDVSIPAREINLHLDARATAERAYSVGREGSVFRRLWQRVGATLGVAGAEPVVRYDAGALRAAVHKRVAASAGGGSREAGIRLKGSNVVLVEPRKGYRVDIGASVERAERAIRDLSGEAELVTKKVEPGPSGAAKQKALKRARRAVEQPLVLAYGDRNWTLSSARVADALRLSDGKVELDRKALGKEISGTLGTLGRSPTDARMTSGERGSVQVVPARDGRQVRVDRLLGEIGAGVFEGRHRYEVPVAEIKPGFTTQEAEAAKPNTMLGEFRTSYKVFDEPPRVANLGIASEAVDGTIIAPGEAFSFNGAAAPISRYEPSPVILDGRLQTALGGGLCQVASTLYMAANYAGLGIVERHPHSAELPYIRPGFDATVWFGSLDLKLKNNTGGYLLLEEKVDKQTKEVVARVYGQPTGREVKMSSHKLSDEGGTTRWRSTRKVVEDGKVVENGTLNTDTYQSLHPRAPAPTGRGA